MIGPPKARPLKIGYGRDAKKRLSHLQVGSPEELQVWYELEMLSCDEAKRIERELHKRLKAKYIRGEWFDASLEESIAHLDDIIDTQVYAARVLMRFDTRPYIDSARYETIKQSALRTMVKQCPSLKDNQEIQVAGQR